jgi:hypothetical protein
MFNYFLNEKIEKAKENEKIQKEKERLSSIKRKSNK